jgi:hypothetical protein
MTKVVKTETINQPSRPPWLGVSVKSASIPLPVVGDTAADSLDSFHRIALNLGTADNPA